MKNNQAYICLQNSYCDTVWWTKIGGTAHENYFTIKKIHSLWYKTIIRLLNGTKYNTQEIVKIDFKYACMIEYLFSILNFGSLPEPYKVLILIKLYSCKKLIYIIPSKLLWV